MAALSSERRPAISFQVNTYNGDIYRGNISNSTVGGFGNDNKVESRSTSFAEGKLIQNVAHQAFYNSGEAADLLKCHRETRVAVLAELQEWVDHLEQDSFIKWVKGSAGVGKTVIVRTMAEMLAERKQLLASFFFWRSGQQCNNAQKFVATISYQICQLLPDCKPLITQVVEEDPKIFTRAMRVQIEKLITNPMLSTWRDKRPDTSGALVIVIDGLDECLKLELQSQDINNRPQDEDRQCEILREVHRALSQLQQHEIPLRLLIASRPERHIQGVFDRDLKQNTSSIMLNVAHDATNDIRRYYIDKFSSIRDHHLLQRHLPSPKWPSANQLDELVKRASGQFIYASTVMQFIGATRKNPSIQLDVILASKEHTELRPLEELDVLYLTIFRQIDQKDWPATRQLLGILLSPPNLRTRRKPPTFWDLFLGWQFGEVERLLMALHSVLEIRLEGSYEFFHFYHASLQEFLLDPARSGPFFIDLNATREEMAILCINHLSTWDWAISGYLFSTMTNWLRGLKLTPTLKKAFIKGGVDGVYPQNLGSAFPTFLDAIAVAEETRQGDLKEDLSAYLLVVAAYPGLDLPSKQFFLGSLFIVDISYNAAQTDRKGLGLIGFLGIHQGLAPFFAKALSSVLEKMPTKDTLFARSASVFISAFYQHGISQWYVRSSSVLFSFIWPKICLCQASRVLYTRNLLWNATNLLEHLLQNAAPSHSLQDCIQEYLISDPSQIYPALQVYIVRMKADAAKYIARVEAEDAHLQSGDSDSQLNGEPLLLDAEISSVELTPAVRTEPEVTHPLPEVPQAKRKRKRVGQIISSFWAWLTGRGKQRQ
ncbi:hypothetical protein CVT26_006313 [Gymnopilus dilepis]|uniref:Nephrocystin 3-like N-terminal domain-containing protein n=1 Tax=Gymnopilus dilepis TaxID=231916 RepID=A0A409W651_9AGAR|nr:hypothetical protein CVT26_006313 [Gymnopilus dilepis]